MFSCCSDFGYERTAGEDCEKSTWFDVDEPLTHCPEGTYYNRTKG